MQRAVNASTARGLTRKAPAVHWTFPDMSVAQGQAMLRARPGRGGGFPEDSRPLKRRNGQSPRGERLETGSHSRCRKRSGLIIAER